MNQGRHFYFGLLAALFCSWCGGVLLPCAQLSRLEPFFDANEEKSFPEKNSGIAAQGEVVYADLGCAACHTRMVRRHDLEPDKTRGWGSRQSVARDYIYEEHLRLGRIRLGPDLANLGRRMTPYVEEDLYQLLYAGLGRMPGYTFLFEPVPADAREAASPLAFRIRVRSGQNSGKEVVPTQRARALVTYLLSMYQRYEYPEVRANRSEATREDRK